MLAVAVDAASTSLGGVGGAEGVAAVGEGCEGIATEGVGLLGLAGPVGVPEPEGVGVGAGLGEGDGSTGNSPLGKLDSSPRASN